MKPGVQLQKPSLQCCHLILGMLMPPFRAPLSLECLPTSPPALPSVWRRCQPYPSHVCAQGNIPLLCDAVLVSAASPPAVSAVAHARAQHQACVDASPFHSGFTLQRNLGLIRRNGLAAMTTRQPWQLRRHRRQLQWSSLLAGSRCWLLRSRSRRWQRNAVAIS